MNREIVHQPPSKEEMDAVFALCRSNHWKSCLQCLKDNPLIGKCTMVMDNNILTTVLHQAITSKASVQERADVILQILSTTPEAARIKNGYGSLCLHCACQRNVKLDAKTKEAVILKLVDAFPGALVEEGGIGGRTPIHILFTDYISPKLTRAMIQRAPAALFKKDKKGWLPLHVAVSRHVSPDKLKMLLAANPASIREVTNDQKTALQLARTTATRSHPNYALIRALQEALPEGGDGVGIPSNAAAIVPTRVSSNDSAESNEEKTTKKRKAKGKHGATKTPRKRKRSGVKREITGLGTIETPVAADLLLHFSRGGGTATESKPGEVNARATQVAEV